MIELHIPEEVTTLGGAVRWARERRGLSLDALAALVGCSHTTIYLVESGRGTRLHWELATHLGVSVVELEGRRPGRPEQRKPRAELTKAQAAARPTIEPRRCGLCRKVDHLTIGCPLRSHRQQKLCPDCCNLAHRRPARGCRFCGGRYESEVIEREAPTAQSSAQLCVEVA